jgi:hypothetical protein
MQQIVYISTATPAAAGNIATILAASRRNNGEAGITGLLYSDGVRFLQVLEGPPEAVKARFDVIAQDPRHRAVVVLSRREITNREFGDWAMAHQSSATDAEAFVARIDRMVANASPSVRATFEGFARHRRAA